MFNTKEFGATIRKLRKDKGFTILRMALELNIHQSYLSQIERGIKPPSVDIALNLANYFNIGLDTSEFAKQNNSVIAKNIMNKTKTLDEKDKKLIYKTLLKFIILANN